MRGSWRIVVLSWLVAIAIGPQTVAEGMSAGAHVMPKSLDVPLCVGCKVLARAHQLNWPRPAVHVGKGFVWVQHDGLGGWVRRDGVVQLEAAVEFYDQQLESRAPSGRHSQYLRLRGDCRLHLGEYEKAADDYGRALSLRPDAATYARRAEAVAGSERYEESLADCNVALRLDPKSSEAYLWRGELHRSAKRLDAAIADFDEAIRLKPQSTRALIGRAFTWLMKGDRTKAVADTDRLVDVERSADNFEVRATVHLLAGNNEAATRDIEAGLRLDPHHPSLRPMQVMVLVASGVPEAIPAEFLNDPAQGGPLNAIVATSLSASGRFGEALAAVDRALSLDEQPGYRFLRATIVMRMQDHQQALNDLNLILREYPDSSDALIARGTCYLHLTRSADAFADLDKALGVDPRNARAYAARGEAWLSLGLPQSAMEDFDGAVAIDPAATSNYVRRATAALHLGQFEKAIVDSARAIQLIQATEPSGTWTLDTRPGGCSARFRVRSSTTPQQLVADELAALRTRSWAYFFRGDFSAGLADLGRCVHLGSRLR